MAAPRLRKCRSPLQPHASARIPLYISSNGLCGARGVGRHRPQADRTPRDLRVRRTLRRAVASWAHRLVKRVPELAQPGTNSTLDRPNRLPHALRDLAIRKSAEVGLD